MADYSKTNKRAVPNKIIQEGNNGILIISRTFILNLKVLKYFSLNVLTLFLWGGPFGRQQPKTVWHFYSFMAAVNKTHDYVYFSTCISKAFFDKKKL